MTPLYSSESEFTCVGRPRVDRPGLPCALTLSRA